MRWVEEHRDPVAMKKLAARVAEVTTRPWTLMEICGGQTHSIARFGIEDLLPGGLRLVHGPGCPVCVTPLEVLEAARVLALRPETTLHTFGDMLRVPGAHGDLLDARSLGADVRVVLSPLDAVRTAEREPDRHHVFFGVGFETTAPAVAMAAELARRLDLGNFSLLVAHVRVPPAIEVLLSSEGCEVQGFLAAGHVCTVMGTAEYVPLAERFRVPIVVTGFEPVDLLQGVLLCVRQLEEGRHEVEIQYDRCVRPDGSPAARAMMERVFEVVDSPFRGLGVVPQGGLSLRPGWERFDARARLRPEVGTLTEPEECLAGLVLAGRIAPTECPELGGRCTPDHPLGAPMVSTEGACAAYYRYRRRAGEGSPA